MVRGTVILMLEEASHSVAGGSCGSSQGRDTITIGMINETSVWGISLLENYSQSGRSHNSGEGTARCTFRRDG